MRILLTGAAGFIGMHAAKALLARGDEVYGVDNLNDYYEVSLKEARADIVLAQHRKVRLFYELARLNREAEHPLEPGELAVDLAC